MGIDWVEALILTDCLLAGALFTKLCFLLWATGVPI